MAKRRKKTDLSEQWQHVREARELLERRRLLREQREADERKKAG